MRPLASPAYGGLTAEHDRLADAADSVERLITNRLIEVESARHRRNERCRIHDYDCTVSAPDDRYYEIDLMVRLKIRVPQYPEAASVLADVAVAARQVMRDLDPNRRVCGEE